MDDRENNEEGDGKTVGRPGGGDSCCCCCPDTSEGGCLVCWGNSLNDIDEKVRCLLEILDDSVLCSRDEDVLGDMLRDLFDDMGGSGDRLLRALLRNYCDVVKL